MIKDDPTIFYPSVECGALDINKAKIKLQWDPTPFTEAIKETNKFFMEAKGKYEMEEQKVEEKITKKLKI